MAAASTRRNAPRASAGRLDGALFEAVEATVGALHVIAKAISDPEYLKSQPAERVGALYGVLADKAVRFLEAASAAECDSDSQPEGSGDPA